MPGPTAPENAEPDPSLPAAFLDRLSQLVPIPDLPATLAGFTRHKPPCFRINPLRVPQTDLDCLLADLHQAELNPQPIAWCPNAFSVPPDRRQNLTHHPAAADGRIFIQSRSSLLPALLLDPRPGEEILDLAAAPGGKTLHLAAIMGNTGRIAAVEPVANRFHRLRANVERAGATIVELYRRDGRDVGRRTPARFDRVLLDAPCSGEARFDPDRPQSFAFWSARKLAEMQRKQRALLRSALDAVRPGGLVLYATCSMAPEENELVVGHALRRLGPAVDLLPLEDSLPQLTGPPTPLRPGLTAWAGQSLDPRLDRCRRVLPDARFDAFFLALFKRH